MVIHYVPERGDFVWLTFSPQSGHEQAGRRPGLVLSPASYNRSAGLALFCPITSKAKGYPFEAAIPEGLLVSGVVLSDQLRSLDWQARGVAFSCKAPVALIEEVTGKAGTLLRG